MQHVAPSDLLALLAQLGASQPQPLILDVREPWEVALASICPPGVELLNLPIGSVVERLAELDPTRPVICMCHHAGRSAEVAAFLSHSGFAAVYNLQGGIDAWSREVDPAVPRY